MPTEDIVLQTSEKGERLRGASQTVRIDSVTFAGRFGALHRPAEGSALGVTVVICPPVGPEARSAYRPMFLFAEMLAAKGFQVLRYDHLGEGDSLPLDADVDQWRHWQEGVEAAAAFARARTGSQGLVLAGLRIGASLAALAAPSVKPDGLMLLAPLPSGKVWLREVRMAAAMAGVAPAKDGAIELDGGLLSRATIDAAAGFDLRRLGPAPCSVFLAAPAPDPRLVASLGPQVVTAPFDGYGELLTHAHLNIPPTALYESAAAWLEDLARKTPPARTAPPLPPAQLSTADWIEQPVRFGAGLRGVLCLPTRPSGEVGVLIGNTGGDPRAGIGNFGAQACRALAARGVPALRFDFQGLGESAAPPDDWRTHVYTADRLPDYRAAAGVLEQLGCSEVVLAGVCAAGFQGLRAAMDDPRFRRVIAFNAWLVYRPGLGSGPSPVKSESAPSRRWINLGALLRPGGWRRLLSGEIHAGQALSVALRVMKRRWSLRRPDGACDAVRRGVLRIADEGARVHLVFGREDESFEALEHDFGADGRWLSRRRGVTVSILPDLDHGLYSTSSRARAMVELLRFVGAKTLARTAQKREPATAPARAAAQPAQLVT